jgi:putative iron-dependent peroxidase
LREFPELSGHGAQVPSTPVPLWCWLRGEDRGDLLHLTRRLEKTLAPAFHLRHVIDAFRHALGESGHGKDLTGYEDGTENPSGEAAFEAALVRGRARHGRIELRGRAAMGARFRRVRSAGQRGPGPSFRPPPQRQRGTRGFADLGAREKDAQESFDPPAFMLRRSMPWLMSTQAGLMFVAFGKSHDAFEAADAPHGRV